MKIRNIIFAITVISCNGYGYVLEDPLLGSIDAQFNKSKHVTKSYYPEWLSNTINLSGYGLWAAQNVLWSRFFDEQSRIDFVRGSLPDSGINPEDPVLFDESELGSLNSEIPVRAVKRSSFETSDPRKGDIKGYQRAFSRKDSGVDELHKLFARGRLKPSELVDRIFDWYDTDLEAHMKDVLIKKHRDLALAMAYASDERWEACQNDHGGQLVVCRKKGVVKLLDGIPVAVKDEVSVKGYTTSYGLDPKRVTGHVFTEVTPDQESEVVAFIKKAGAVVIGKANQHIFGLGGTGENPHFTRQSNIFSPYHVPGGSSSGSALAVALNISQLAIGTDGGGSVSIPAAANGLPGLKPTVNKLSAKNYDDAAPGLVSIGLIGKTFKDIAVGYQASSKKYPTAEVVAALEDIKIGVDPAWFEHAHKDVTEKTMVCLDRLSQVLQWEHKGWKHNPVVKMRFMPDEFRKQLWATHIVLFGKGEAEGKAHFIDKGIPEETMMALTMGLALTDSHVNNAKENQSRLKRHFQENLFSKVDILAMPTLLTGAPDKADNWLPQWKEVGELNLSKAYLLAFHTSLANLTGSPRVTIPCGFDSDNLPIGLQLMGGDDSEYLLILLGDMLEQEMASDLNAAPAMQNRPALFDPRVTTPEVYQDGHTDL